MTALKAHNSFPHKNPKLLKTQKLIQAGYFFYPSFVQKKLALYYYINF